MLSSGLDTLSRGGTGHTFPVMLITQKSYQRQMSNYGFPPAQCRNTPQKQCYASVERHL